MQERKRLSLSYKLSLLSHRTVRTGKEIKERKYGKAFVGGPFSLVEAKSGKLFTQDNLVGQWNLVYFGFTNCPDVCPEELDKMTVVVNEIGASCLFALRNTLKNTDVCQKKDMETRSSQSSLAATPHAIPMRHCESISQVGSELRYFTTNPITIPLDFHPRMVGLTGTYDAVKAACKAYRVYFSTPPNTKPGTYLLSVLFEPIAYETIMFRGRLPR